MINFLKPMRVNVLGMTKYMIRSCNMGLYAYAIKDNVGLQLCSFDGPGYNECSCGLVCSEYTFDVSNQFGNPE